MILVIDRLAVMYFCLSWHINDGVLVT